MKRLHPVIKSVSIILFAMVFFLTACSPEVDEYAFDDAYEPYATPVPHSFSEPDSISIEKLFLELVDENQDDLMFTQNYPIIEEIEFSEDHALAMIWYALVDKDNNTIQPGEPGLALAQKDETASWRVLIKTNPDWYDTLQLFPESMINYELELFSMPNEQKEAHDGLVYTGYRLPWPAGKAVRVSGSVGHVYLYKSCPNTCRFAYDFADGTMFPVVAAKGGTVEFVVWHYPNGNTKHANYIVLRDTTTIPTTYQVYYHLAQDSIPPELRVRGATVVQGQYLGNADDTGYSTGHHLHFHVHTRSGAVWGPSVDIVFEDVDVNGGRPRTSYEAATFPKLGTGYHKGNWFVSDNGDTETPTGTINSPNGLDVISTRYLKVSGTAQDDYGVAFLQVLATFDGIWYPVGPLMKSAPFETTIDLCEAGIPNGSFFLSLQVIDTAGKKSEGFPGLIKLDKRYACPLETSECKPALNQAGVYSSTAYGGACMVLDQGKYTEGDFIAILQDGVQSINLGKASIANLYDNPDFEGEPTIILKSDDNLAETINFSEGIRAIEVLEKPDLPATPLIHQPRNQHDLSPTVEDEVILDWDIDAGVDNYHWELSGPDGYFVQSDTENVNSFNAGYLPQGEYLFLLTAENVIGSTQGSVRFTVRPIDDASQSILQPMQEITTSTAIELKWEIPYGGEDLAGYEFQIKTNDGEWQDWQRNISGQMRQAWFIGEPGNTYAFRMRSIDLASNIEEYPESAEAVTTIEDVCIVDEYESGEDSAVLVNASLMELNQRQIHNICAAGDVDWITFPINEGEKVQISSTPISGAAATILQIYRSDRYTKLAEVYPDALDSETTIDWQADSDGIYFLRIMPLDQKIFGSDARYEIAITRAGEKPEPNFLLPAIALPFVWFLIKIASSVRIKKKRE
ncbi:MAG: M23 family metallopeptidase [Anaerolineaceae bacterium]|nr:M23 family metallopeptidase [Anaerolineaceae bacterium]